jgi:hypothetical protein
VPGPLGPAKIMPNASAKQRGRSCANSIAPPNIRRLRRLAMPRGWPRGAAGDFFENKALSNGAPSAKIKDREFETLSLGSKHGFFLMNL